MWYAKLQGFGFKVRVYAFFKDSTSVCNRKYNLALRFKVVGFCVQQRLILVMSGLDGLGYQYSGNGVETKKLTRSSLTP